MNADRTRNPEVLNFIDGQWVAAQEGAWLANVEPATGQPLGRLPDSDASDVARAVTAARGAFSDWMSRLPGERASILREIARGIRAQIEELAQIESLDNGKPVSVARTVDIPRAAQNFEFFADAITQGSSELHVTSGTVLNYTLRQPLGPVACISPWNLPLYLLTWKIAPALAAGCTVVAKPSEITPLSAHALSRICVDAGLPPGVLNFVHGTGARAGAALVAHPEIRAVSFTGSTRTGAEISRVAAPLFKKLSLELGGKNATIIFSDCDFDRAIEETLRSAYANQGQICLCGSRILVERPLYDQFRDALAERVRALKVGDPIAAQTEQGALVSKEHYDKVISHLEQARQDGARFLAGGASVTLKGRCASGWFVQPTLIEGLGPECRANQEEIFGPVATILPFDTEDEAIAIANGTRYGLAASIWTNDLRRTHSVSARLQAGVVWVNCWMLRDLRTPFGGTKDSGVGREGGTEALRFFTEAKNVCIQS